jgi:branched-chain amino acid transport system substrate-binding protein
MAGLRTSRAWLFVVLLAFCAHAPAQGPIVVGAALPRSGALADFGAPYERALELWKDEVNAAGGVLGRRIELRILDDGSDASRSGPLYEALIREHRADLLIGPFGSAATLGAAAVAERARRVLMNAAGASGAVHRRAPRFVFQVVAPYGAYGAGAIELAAASGYKNLFIVSRDDPVSREMAEGAREAALKRALRAPEVVFYRPGLEEFTAEATKARAQGAEAWIAFTDVREAAGLVRTFRQLDYAPASFLARGVADARLIDFVGQDAEFALGLAEYQPAWRTERNARFVEGYRARWSANPPLAGAQAYAAATVLGEALRRAGSTDQEKLRAMLVALEMQTVLGRYKVDPASGAQVGARPAVVQILNGRPEVVWPAALQTARIVLPYPAWSERRVLR